MQLAEVLGLSWQNIDFEAKKLPYMSRFVISAGAIISSQHSKLNPVIAVFWLMDFAGEHRDVAAPLYTDGYETIYRDVLNGCAALLEKNFRQLLSNALK